MSKPVYVDEAMHKVLKAQAAAKGITVKKLLEELVGGAGSVESVQGTDTTQEYMEIRPRSTEQFIASLTGVEDLEARWQALKLWWSERTGASYDDDLMVTKVLDWELFGIHERMKAIYLKKHPDVKDGTPQSVEDFIKQHRNEDEDKLIAMYFDFVYGKEGDA